MDINVGKNLCAKNLAAEAAAALILRRWVYVSRHTTKTWHCCTRRRIWNARQNRAKLPSDAFLETAGLWLRNAALRQMCCLQSELLWYRKTSTWLQVTSVVQACGADQEQIGNVAPPENKRPKTRVSLCHLARHLCGSLVEFPANALMFVALSSHPSLKCIRNRSWRVGSLFRRPDITLSRSVTSLFARVFCVHVFAYSLHLTLSLQKKKRAREVAGDCSEQPKSDELNPWTRVMLKESYYQPTQEDEQRNSIVQEVLQRVMDSARRIIAPVIK